MESKLKVTDLHFSYDREAEVLKGLNAAFPAGRITALIGPNGCGKSTLLNLMAGVLRPDKGQILLNGEDIRRQKRNQLARQLAAVHQSNTAPTDITVEKLVALGRTPYQGLLRRADAADARAVERAMEDTDVAGLAKRPVSALSGGQLQRVWLAMALAQETDVLLLDELTTYLDIHYQLELMHLVAGLNRKKGITIITVMHDINLAFEFCHEVLIMKGGCALAQGSIESVVSEEILAEAFDVSARLLSVEGRKHCIFGRQGGTL